jgi:hypothetical protein
MTGRLLWKPGGNLGKKEQKRREGLQLLPAHDPVSSHWAENSTPTLPKGLCPHRPHNLSLALSLAPVCPVCPGPTPDYHSSCASDSAATCPTQQTGLAKGPTHERSCGWFQACSTWWPAAHGGSGSCAVSHCPSSTAALMAHEPHPAPPWLFLPACWVGRTIAPPSHTCLVVQAELRESMEPPQASQRAGF